MESFIDVLDAAGMYHAADELTKIAVNLDMGPSKDFGQFGKYYSQNYPGVKEKLKNEMGVNSEDAAIKSFYKSEEAVEEVLIMNYVLKYISSSTDLVVPQTSFAMSPSAAMLNGGLVTQHIDGILAIDLVGELSGKTGRSDHDERIMAAYLTDDAENRILQKLKSIGVEWHDPNTRNWMFDRKVVENFIKEVKEKGDKEWFKFTLDFDLSKNAKIIDIGDIKVKKSTPPGQQLMKLYDKIKDKVGNHYVRKVMTTIRMMIV